MTQAAPRLSVVVICFNMRREIARTLLSLGAAYQRGIDRDSYEVILVDNGSAEPPVAGDFADLALDLRILRCPDPRPSPVAALNLGLAACRGALIGVMIDGARMATPGLLAAALLASRLHERAIVFTQSLMLGRGLQWEIASNGYDRHAEDELLNSIGWPDDGYRLFEIATWLSNHTDGRRWSTPFYESNALFMPRALWAETGGYDPAFQAPGGGAASADLFIRATGLNDTQIVVLTGEATFHQIHADSISTSCPNPANNLKSFSREYYNLRQHPLRPVRADFWTFSGRGRAAVADRRRTKQAAGPSPPAGAAVALRRRYVDLLKAVLLNEHGLELEAALLDAREELEGRPSAKHRPGRALRRLARGRETGVMLEKLTTAYTLIGRRRLDNIEACAADVIGDDIRGDFIECGVWRGGACILMRGILDAYGIQDRAVWVADSFAGLPPPDPDTDDDLDLTPEQYPLLAVDQGRVARNFERFGLLDGQVRFLAGWFKDTLPQAPIERLAILRLDGDLYSSTMDSLRSLYDKVEPGGFVIIDDYGAFAQCARAVEDFRSARRIAEPLRKIDWAGVFWRKN